MFRLVMHPTAFLTDASRTHINKANIENACYSPTRKFLDSQCRIVRAQINALLRSNGLIFRMRWQDMGYNQRFATKNFVLLSLS